MSDLQIGSVVDGKYQIQRKIAAGSSGIIYEAINPSIGRVVALKVLSASSAPSPEMVRRFLNEARAANQIRHPAVVDISERGVLPDQSLYLVMEFLEGEDLNKRLQVTGRKLPMPRAVHIAWEIADVVNAAHQAGIVHRDLKPGNIMLVPDDVAVYGERVKLLDFGIAKLVHSGEALTSARRVLGSLRYMAPEQFMSSRNVDGKADVYSLGVMLFEMLSGKLPPGPDPTNLAALAPAVPPDLCGLVQTMLARQRDQRPTMSVVAERLLALDSMFMDSADEGITPQ